jgi:hypothetical protein
MHEYLEGLLLILRGNKEAGEKKVCEFFSICDFIGLNSFSEKYRIFYNRIITNK